jgi:hypothetical protein
MSDGNPTVIDATAHPWDDSALVEKVEELRFLLNPDHLSEGVVLACLRLRERPEKFFSTVFKPCFAEGASGHRICLEPTNLLCELVLAARAKDWPRFVVLIHDALSDQAVDLP